MNNIEQKNKKSLTISFVITLFFSFVMIVCLFLPYATATESFSESMESYSDTVIYEELDMKVKDLENVSLFEYAKIYTELGEEFLGNESFAVFYTALIGVVGGLSLLTLVFSAFKKAIPTIIFAILSLGVFYLQCWDYTDRGIVPSENYNFGFGCYLFYIASVIVLAGAIWLLVCKVQNKKQLKTNITD